MEQSAFQVYEEEINSLREEIRDLEEQYENCQRESTLGSAEEILKAMDFYRGKSVPYSTRNEITADLESQLDRLESELSLIGELTGIRFASYSKKTVKKTDNKIIQSHRMSGHCNTLPFQLEFHLLEAQVTVEMQ
nr:PREDICTED: centromere protein P-like isoform X1 [Latimeria chalumnae]|eukprot:XP_005987129.1 PREDICTED: centromere protein P-like isoform X1 [Latimeria chalumnae]